MLGFIESNALRQSNASKFIRPFLCAHASSISRRVQKMASPADAVEFLDVFRGRFGTWEARGVLRGAC